MNYIPDTVFPSLIRLPNGRRY